MTSAELQQYILDNSIPEPNSGCWLWTGALQAKGYGKTVLNGRNTTASRACYAAFIGDPPQGMEVCHKCDVRSCVNPSHLFLGTRKDNAQDAKKKGRLATGERHGMRLHPECRAYGERNGASTHPEKVQRGDLHWTCKHPEKIRNARSPERTALVLRLRSNGLSGRAIARVVGVCHSAIVKELKVYKKRGLA